MALLDLSAANPGRLSTSKCGPHRRHRQRPAHHRVAPELTRAKAGNDFRNLVVVGTGLPWREDDVPGTAVSATDAAQVQTFYVIEDRIEPRRQHRRPRRPDASDPRRGDRRTRTRPMQRTSTGLRSAGGGGSEHQRRTRHDRSRNRTPRSYSRPTSRARPIHACRAGRAICSSSTSQPGSPIGTNALPYVGQAPAGPVWRAASY